MKNMSLFAFIFIIMPYSALATEMHHHVLKSHDQRASHLMWTVQRTMPFHELLISWSGQRPKKGTWIIDVSVRHNHHWSPWFSFASWSAKEQHLYNLRISRDINNFLKGDKASGFRIRVTPHHGASLRSLRALHTSLTDNALHRVTFDVPQKNSRTLNVPLISQIALGHEDSTRICSPTSTLSALQYLVPEHAMNLENLMKSVFEPRAKIYGAWALNVAQAAHELGSGWYCYIARYSSIQQLVDQINAGYPVVVSIQGPIAGSARPYENGHLMVIRGYDAVHKKVLCMDPAFPTDEETYVAYNVEDFITAWRRRNGLAYIMTKTLPATHHIS